MLQGKSMSASTPVLHFRQFLATDISRDENEDDSYEPTCDEAESMEIAKQLLGISAPADLVAAMGGMAL